MRASARRAAREDAAATAQRLAGSLEATQGGLGLLLRALRDGGFAAAVDDYRKMQLVLIQQRAWARAQGRVELDDRFAAIARTAGEIRPILAGMAEIMEVLEHLDRVELAREPPRPDPAATALVARLLERASLSVAKAGDAAAGLVAAGVLERRGRGRGRGYRLAGPIRAELARDLALRAAEAPP